MLPAPGAPKPKREWDEIPLDLLDGEEQHAYKILREIMHEVGRGSDRYFMNAFDHPRDDVDTDDYHQVIKQPMWLTRIKENLQDHKYISLTSFVRDVRLMLENCYRYHGPDHPATKKGVKLEMMLEQKLALLPRDLREKTTLEVTTGRLFQDQAGPRRRPSSRTFDGTSTLLSFVKNEKANRDKELRRKQMEERKAEKEEKEKEIVRWEDDLMKEPLRTEIRASWEIPQIAHFLSLCRKILKLPEMSVYEFERSLLMPQQSLLFSKIMTCLLLSPTLQMQLDRPSMPYHVWNNKLKNKIHGWYKLYHTKNSATMVFDRFGIETPFFQIVGRINPLEDKMFHELSFHQRIWLVKSLCDCMLLSHKAVQEIADDPNEDLRESVLGQDVYQNFYIYFPQFSAHCLRIYRQALWSPPNHKRKNKKMKYKSTKNENADTKKGNLDPTETDAHCKSPDGKTKASKKGDFQLNVKKFELVAESVESLRALIVSVEEQISSFKLSRQKVHENNLGKKLVRNLKSLLAELEPAESKYQQTVRRLQCKLHKEWNDFWFKKARNQAIVEAAWNSDSNSGSSSSDETDGNSVDDNTSNDSESWFVMSTKDKLAAKRKLSSPETQLHDGSFGKKRTKGASPTVTKRRKQSGEKIASGAARGLLLSHSKQNTTTQARELFAWETLRQILISPHPTTSSSEEKFGSPAHTPSVEPTSALGGGSTVEDVDFLEAETNESNETLMSSTSGMLLNIGHDDSVTYDGELQQEMPEVGEQLDASQDDSAHYDELETDVSEDLEALVTLIAKEHDYALSSSCSNDQEQNDDDDALAAFGLTDQETVETMDLLDLLPDSTFIEQNLLSLSAVDDVQVPADGSTGLACPTLMTNERSAVNECQIAPTVDGSVLTGNVASDRGRQFRVTNPFNVSEGAKGTSAISSVVRSLASDCRTITSAPASKPAVVASEVNTVVSSSQKTSASTAILEAMAKSLMKEPKYDVSPNGYSSAATRVVLSNSLATSNVRTSTNASDSKTSSIVILGRSSATSSMPTNPSGNAANQKPFEMATFPSHRQVLSSTILPSTKNSQLPGCSFVKQSASGAAQASEPVNRTASSKGTEPGRLGTSTRPASSLSLAQPALTKALNQNTPTQQVSYFGTPNVCTQLTLPSTLAANHNVLAFKTVSPAGTNETEPSASVILSQCASPSTYLLGTSAVQATTASHPQQGSQLNGFKPPCTKSTTFQPGDAQTVTNAIPLNSVINACGQFQISELQNPPNRTVVTLPSSLPASNVVMVNDGAKPMLALVINGSVVPINFKSTVSKT